MIMKSLMALLVMAGAFAATTATPLPVFAAEPRAVTLSAPQLEQVKRVEDYLNGITTLKARFLQRTDEGDSSGIFYLARPGKMRLDYDPPSKNYIVTMDGFIYFWDGELKQQSSAPIGSTLADFFLRDHITLSGDIAITGFAQAANIIQITVIEAGDPGQGQLSMVFEDHPLSLRKWRVFDSMGRTTEVALQDVETGVTLDHDLFVFVDPTMTESLTDRGRGRGR